MCITFGAALRLHSERLAAHMPEQPVQKASRELCRNESQCEMEWCPEGSPRPSGEGIANPCQESFTVSRACFKGFGVAICIWLGHSAKGGNNGHSTTAVIWAQAVCSAEGMVFAPETPGKKRPCPPSTPEALSVPSALADSDGSVGCCTGLTDEVESVSIATPSSTTDVASSAGPGGKASPTKMRRLARQTLRFAMEFHTDKLPDVEDVTMVSLLAWLAAVLVRRHGWQDVKLRKRFKRELSLAEVCVALAKDPLCHLPPGQVSGTQRVRACQEAAKVLAKAYDLRARAARKLAEKLWARTPPEVKDKWWLLPRYDQYEVPEGTHLFSAQQGPSSDVLECHGAMFTWQTTIGRESDRVREWVQLGITRSTLCDLMKDDADLKQYFEKFKSWVSAMCEGHGYKHWSAAMEVSPSGQAAVVHLHAYVCVDWKAVARRDCQKPRSDRGLWQYKSFHPHITPTAIRGNANAQKVLTQGLIYCMLDKIGGVFTASNTEAGKDRGSAGTRASLKCARHREWGQVRQTVEFSGNGIAEVPR